MAENGKRITLLSAAEAEIEEKKSIFIGYAAPVSNEEEAKAIVAEKKKEFSDATHNVWAYYMKKVYDDKSLGYSTSATFDLPADFNPCNKMFQDVILDESEADPMLFEEIIEE